jgi:23S rRNA (cytosine1962-C5)-methyltransferase
MAPRRRVALRKNLARAVEAGHPWIFRDALRPLSGIIPDDGDLVLVTTSSGRPLGRGFWTVDTPIAVRMLTTDAHDDIDVLMRTRLTRALDRRLALLDRTSTNAFRWVHGEADLMPGIHLDVYDVYASVRFDGAGARAFYRRFVPALMDVANRIGLRTIVERVDRPGRSGAHSDQSAREHDDHARAVELAGILPTDEIEVRENGLRFGADLLNGQKGGLFLDQRDNRQRVRGLARGLRVLNLFSYTGGFSVYAAAGGAKTTTTVDVAAPAIAAARRNFARNHLDAASARFAAVDVFQFLTDAKNRGEVWDLVISDPPSFAPNHGALPEALRAYRRLHRLCAAVTAPGGILCAASCSSHVDAAAFSESIAGGCADAGRRFNLQEQHGGAADHPVLDVFPQGTYLKFVIGRVS